MTLHEENSLSSWEFLSFLPTLVSTGIFPPNMIPMG